MQEIEAKFLNINREEIIQRLLDIGAEVVFDERLLKRCAFSLATKIPGEWIRVRDEVDKITLTYKRVHTESIDGVELEIDSFENGILFLQKLGLIQTAYQETKRIRYFLKEDNVTFDIDTWPALNSWIEIESSSEQMVKKYAELLGFKWEDAMFGSADFVYAKIYNVTTDWINNHCPILTFNNIPKELKPENKKNTNE